MGRDGKTTETSSFQLSLLFLPGFTNAIGSTSEQRSPGYMLFHDCGRECDMFCIEHSKCDDLSFLRKGHGTRSRLDGDHRMLMLMQGSAAEPGSSPGKCGHMGKSKGSAEGKGQAKCRASGKGRGGKGTEGSQGGKVREEGCTSSPSSRKSNRDCRRRPQGLLVGRGQCSLGCRGVGWVGMVRARRRLLSS